MYSAVSGLMKQYGMSQQEEQTQSEEGADQPDEDVRPTTEQRTADGMATEDASGAMTDGPEGPDDTPMLNFWNKVKTAVTSKETYESLQKGANQFATAVTSEETYRKLGENAKGFASNVKEKVENLNQDFERMNQDFVNEKRKQTQGVQPPWAGYDNSDELKEKILNISSDSKYLLSAPSASARFEFDFETYEPVAAASLEADPRLQELRKQLVPKEIKEQEFWRNYFYRVHLIKQSSSLMTTRGSPRGSPSSELNVTEDGVAGTKTSRPLTPASLNGSGAELSGGTAVISALKDSSPKPTDPMSAREPTSETTTTAAGKAAEDEAPEWEKELEAELDDLDLGGDLGDVGAADIDFDDLENEL
eukprot:Clim_evm51s136 gene=Clim_evmTU51s136